VHLTERSSGDAFACYQPASVGSTEAANEVVARFGVIDM
jgi:hypothetical protein